jgi:hypothetical protein
MVVLKEHFPFRMAESTQFGIGVHDSMLRQILQIEEYQIGSYCSRYGGGKKYIHNFGRKPKRKRPLARSMLIREDDNIIMDLK